VVQVVSHMHVMCCVVLHYTSSETWDELWASRTRALHESARLARTALLEAPSCYAVTSEGTDVHFQLRELLEDHNTLYVRVRGCVC
jgi:uncharacterized protein with gpF-like domain